MYKENKQKLVKKYRVTGYLHVYNSEICAFWPKKAICKFYSST